MDLFQKLLIRLRLRRVSQQDVARGVIDKDVGFLQLAIRYGTYRERVAAVLGLGKLRQRNSIPVLTRLLWDDFESVAQAARKSLAGYLPDPQVEGHLKRAMLYWSDKEEQRSLKRKAIWFNKNNPLLPPAPLVDRSKMETLARVKVQLRKSIRFWQQLQLPLLQAIEASKYILQAGSKPIAA